MSIFVWISFLAICYGDLFCYSTSCHQYDPNNKICKHIGHYDETKYYINITDWHLTCLGELSYCSLNGSSQDMTCQTLTPINQPCKYSIDCQSNFCSLNVCKNWPLMENDSCSEFFDECMPGYSCIECKCIKAKKTGDICNRSTLYEGGCEYPFDRCFNGKCTHAFSLLNGQNASQSWDMYPQYMCRSYRVDNNGVCLDSTKLPILKTDVNTHFKKCALHSDCVYTNEYNSSLPSEPCLCPCLLYTSPSPRDS